MRTLYSLLTLATISCFVLSINAIAEGLNSEHSESEKHLVGVIDSAALSEPPYSDWFSQNHTEYTPDEEILNRLTSPLKGIRVKVFMGTWCHDSQREVPRLYKILESSDFDLTNLSIVSLNHDKKTPSGLERGFDIRRTPTIIFMKDGVEVGRIVETPRDSLENDILKIVTGQEYKHSYQ